MQDNTKRGERVLFWMKVIFILFVAFWLQFVFMVASIYLLFGHWLALCTGMLFMAFAFCIGAGIFISLVVFCISYLSWLHRAISNLRLLTTTSFSPMGAVLLTCIPFIGYFLNYFIFSDMVKSQEKYMQQKGILKERFPKRILNAWLIASLLLLLIVFVDPNQLGFLTVVSPAVQVDGNKFIEFLEKTLVVVIPILYIMSFSAYAKQEREIFRIHTEELFNKHVDEVIREREIERVAKMIRESENNKKSQLVE